MQRRSKSAASMLAGRGGQIHPEAKFALQFIASNMKSKEMDRRVRNKNYQLLAIAIISQLFWIVELLFVSGASHWPAEVCLELISGEEAHHRIYMPYHYPLGAIVCQAGYTACTLVLLFLIYQYYLLQLDIEYNEAPSPLVAKLIGTDDDGCMEDPPNLWNSRLLKPFLLECFVLIIQPIPFLNLDSETYHAASFWRQQVDFGCIMSFRIYFLFRCIRDASLVFKRRRDLSKFKVLKNAALEYDWEFATKASYHKHSVFITFLLCFIATFYFTWAFYAAEWSSVKYVFCEQGVAETSFSYDLAIFMSVTTITAAGVEDVVPTTQYGRAVYSFGAITGMLISALIVATFMKWTELSEPQLMALGWVYVERYKEKARDAARILMKELFLRYFKRRQKKKATSKRRQGIETSEEQHSSMMIENINQEHRSNQSFSAKFSNWFHAKKTNNSALSIQDRIRMASKQLRFFSTQAKRASELYATRTGAANSGGNLDMQMQGKNQAKANDRRVYQLECKVKEIAAKMDKMETNIDGKLSAILDAVCPGGAPTTLNTNNGNAKNNNAGFQRQLSSSSTSVNPHEGSPSLKPLSYIPVDRRKLRTPPAAKAVNTVPTTTPATTTTTEPLSSSSAEIIASTESVPNATIAAPELYDEESQQLNYHPNSIHNSIHTVSIHNNNVNNDHGDGMELFARVVVGNGGNHGVHFDDNDNDDINDEYSGVSNNSNNNNNNDETTALIEEFSELDQQ